MPQLDMFFVRIIRRQWADAACWKLPDLDKGVNIIQVNDNDRNVEEARL